MHNAECYIREKIEDVRKFGNPTKDLLTKIDLAYFHGYIDRPTLLQLVKETHEAKRSFEIERESRHLEFMEKQRKLIEEYRQNHPK